MLSDKDADVGSTAAAAVASALSKAWHNSALHSQETDDCRGKRVPVNGDAAKVNAQLPPRQSFEVVVRLGSQKCVHTLSDPNIRQHVRRLTSMQARLHTVMTWD
jgi:hypothetical protein